MKTSWNKLGVQLSEPILRTLKELNFKETTPVQVPVLLVHLENKFTYLFFI